MGKRKIAIAYVVCVFSASMPQSAAVAAEEAPGASTACVVEASTIASGAARQGAAAAKAGRIPGLGAVTARIGWDNRKTLTLTDDQFTVSRTFDPVTRGVEITVSGAGEETLAIHLGGAEGLLIYSGARRIELSNASELAEVVRGRAVRAFRERIGEHERRLIAGTVAVRPDSAHADGFLLVGAFIGSLAGDSTAVGRARDLIMSRIHGRVRAVRLSFRNCVTDYERYLLDIDTQRTQCLDAANGRYNWYTRVADRLGCEAEFIAGALAGEGQFLSCTALGSIV